MDPGEQSTTVHVCSAAALRPDRRVVLRHLERGQLPRLSKCT